MCDKVSHDTGVTNTLFHAINSLQILLMSNVFITPATCRGVSKGKMSREANYNLDKENANFYILCIE